VLCNISSTNLSTVFVDKLILYLSASNFMIGFFCHASSAMESDAVTEFCQWIGHQNGSPHAGSPRPRGLRRVYEIPAMVVS
jgi:hypothetical protein